MEGSESLKTHSVIRDTERMQLNSWPISSKDVIVDILWDSDLKDELISDLRIKTGRCRDRKKSTVIYIVMVILKTSETVFR